MASGNGLLPPASVVVAAYNAQKTLRECIDTLLALDYPGGRREIIVVENGSHDATPRILEDYRGAVTVLHEARQGPAAARNAGLDRASGDVVAFTDSDCVVDRHWLRRIVSPLEDSTVGAVGGRIMARRPCSRIAEFGERVHDHARAIERLRPPYAITMNWASRRAVLDEVGRFDPALRRCSDIDLAYRLIQAGYRLVYEPGALVYHNNRSTPWALARQGYQHGYYAVPIRRIHAQFLATHREPALLQWPSSFARRVLSQVGTWRDLPWACLFNLAKDVGRLHAQFAAAAAGHPRKMSESARR